MKQNDPTKKTNIYSYDFGNGSLRLYTVIESNKDTQEINKIFFEIALMENRAILNTFSYSNFGFALKEFDYKRRVFETVKKENFVHDLAKYRFLLSEKEYSTNKDVYDRTRYNKTFNVYQTFANIEEIKKNLNKPS